MKKIQPKTLSGFMELLPHEQILFEKIKSTIQTNFEKFGFLPLDTPAVESSEVLLAKVGGETEKQVYHVANGAFDEGKKLCLRYDLTVPLAKYVALYGNQLTFPFRRYQIGKAYRGERPQKGRFREFYQCDIDVIGLNELSLYHDGELPSVIYNIFTQLNIGEFVINISNRKIMKGLFEHLGLQEKSADILRTIDKFEKIGKEKVELILKDDFLISQEQIQTIMQLATLKASNSQIIEHLKNMNIQNTTFTQGVDELEQVCAVMRAQGVPEKNFAINLTITRGLDYYTGTVYETFLTNHRSIGSICSGGRYDNLASCYSDQTMPGVGISIGLTRLFDQLLANQIVTAQKTALTQVLVVPMDQIEPCLGLASALRNQSINCEVYFENTKFKNKLSYANKQNIPFVVIVGQDELAGNYYTLKNMQTGEQTKASVQDIVDAVKNIN